MDDRFTPELRRAVMRVCPEYFTLPRDDREAYYGRLDSDRINALYAHLLDELFDIEATTHDEVDVAVSSLETSENKRLAAALLPLQGIGDDCFWLNEVMGDRLLTDFETLRDYDSHDYAVQEEHRTRADATYIPKPYRGSLYAEWARLFGEESELIYATLFCAAGYLLCQIEEAGEAAIERLVPHRIVRGPKDGQSAANGTIMDIRVDADGFEEIYEQLNDRFHTYQRDRYETLLKRWDRTTPAEAWVIDRTTPGDHEWTFIFSNKGALGKVRLRHFLSDCHAIAGDRHPLDAMTTEERARATRFLEEQHAQIMTDFDPKVRTLRPRIKLVLPPHIIHPLDP